jgi:putative transposase
MWTAADRALVGDFGSGQALSDDQYRLLEPFIPPAKPGGRPRTTDMRRLLDGLFYVVRTGCQWRHLPPPPAFPPWPTVYGYFVRSSRRACGRAYATISSSCCGRARGEKPVPRQPSSTPRASRRRKRGPARLGCAKRLKGPQAPRRGGHAGAAAGRGRACGRHPGR